jgi:rubrerythrin
MGDPACWLNQVCPSCGRMIEREPVDARCPYCDEELPEDIAGPRQG